MTHLSSEIFFLYLDEQLDPSARAAADAHLAACSECRHELTALRDLFAALDNLPDVPIPVHLAANVIAQISPVRPLARAPLAGAVLTIQIAFAVLLTVWLAPTLLSFLAIPSIEPIQDLLDAMAAPIAAFFEAYQLDMIESAPWATLLAIVGIFWIIGNLSLAYEMSRVKLEGAR